MSLLSRRLNFGRNLRLNRKCFHKGIISNFCANQQQSEKQFDVVIVGGGIVGTASARELSIRHPHWKIAVVEKEKRLASHQSGHSSGVIHAGIYYKPGSLKAQLCVQGLRLSYKYFDEKNIPYKKVGKLIVATNEEEVGGLQVLHERGLANEVPDLQLIEGDQIQEIEPHCRGLKALWSPHTGIVDYAMVTQHYADDFKRNGGEIFTGFDVKQFRETETNSVYPVTIESEDSDCVLQTKYVLTCGGLHSDKLAELTGCPKSPAIVPFRGEYLILSPEKEYLVKGNIYPVPDPRFPFLGVHFTPRMDGSIWIGPNAVLAFKREGYKWTDVNLLDLLDSLRYPGFIKLAAKHFGYGLNEMLKSTLIPLQAPHIQKFIPEIAESDLSCGPSGVRAQAVDEDGNLVDDFVFHFGAGETALAKRVMHCRNAPSPGATSSMAIAAMISDKCDQEFKI